MHKFARIGYVKGAPKEVLDLCTTVETLDGQKPLDDEMRAEIVAQNDEFARNGLRVLAMAYRPIATEEVDFSPAETERDLIFVGLMAMMDPPRDEVAVAVRGVQHGGHRGHHDHRRLRPDRRDDRAAHRHHPRATRRASSPATISTT